MTDPLKLKPKMIDINESSIVQFYFTDYADNCIASRSYKIDNTNNNNEDIQGYPYIFESLSDSYKNTNYMYLNQGYDFQLEYPIDWFSRYTKCL